MVLKYYSAYLPIAPSSAQQIYLDDFQAVVNEQFDNAPNILTVKWNGIDIVARVTSKILETNLYRDRDKYRQVIFKELTQKPSIGDVFEFQECKWLCTQTDNLSVGVNDCTVERADNILKFYDESSVLNEIPCIIGDITIGVDSNKYISTASNEVPLTVPNTSVTRQIKSGDVFKIGLQHYSISGVGDDISSVGLIIFKMSYSEVEQIFPVFSVEILNGESLSTNTLKDDVVLSSNLRLTYASSNELVATVNNGLITPVAIGNSTITVSLASDSSVSDSISITVEEVSVVDNYTVSISGATTVKLNNSITLTASVLNNGIVDLTKSVLWSVFNQDGSSNEYVSVVSQDGSNIILKAANNSSYVNKFVVIRASKSDDSSVFDEHNVQIKSIF